MDLILIDDEAEFLEELAEALKESGFNPLNFTRAHDAIEYLEQAARPSIIVTDIRMPYMDGFAFIDAVKEKLLHSDTRFIALTGHGTQADEHRAIASGAEIFLRKPISIIDIVNAIRDIW